MCVICVNSCQPQESLLRRYLPCFFGRVSHVDLEFGDLDRLAGHECQGPSCSGITSVPPCSTILTTWGLFLGPCTCVVSSLQTELCQRDFCCACFLRDVNTCSPQVGHQQQTKAMVPLTSDFVNQPVHWGYRRMGEGLFTGQDDSEKVMTLWMPYQRPTHN